MASLLAHEAIRLEIRAKLFAARKYTFAQRQEMLAAATDSFLELAVANTGTADALAEIEKKASAGGGIFGQIIQAILAFFSSTQGQALIAALIQMLLHLIGG